MLSIQANYACSTSLFIADEETHVNGGITHQLIREAVSDETFIERLYRYLKLTVSNAFQRQPEIEMDNRIINAILACLDIVRLEKASRCDNLAIPQQMHFETAGYLQAIQSLYPYIYHIGIDRKLI